MSTFHKILIAIACALIVAIGVLWYQIASFNPEACANINVKEFMSPDKSMVAVVFERSCGSEDKTSTHISVMQVTDSIGNESGNIFIVKGTAANNPIHLDWVDDYNLRVYRELSGDEFVARDHWQGIKRVNVVYRN